MSSSVTEEGIHRPCRSEPDIIEDQVTTEPHRSTRVRSAPKWYGNPDLEVMLLDHEEPMNYEEAMMSPDSAKWLEAMKSEMGSMSENKVWTLVDLPDDRQAIEMDVQEED
nr:Retrovirus-related Pol polyprotein from transposon TNT 1-94 [Triticum aestivum]